MKLIDVNVTLGAWPFQKFFEDTPARLEATLRREGIGGAWVSAAESILFPDPEVHDELLFRRLRGQPFFRPVKVVNPVLGNWRERLCAAVKQWRVRAIKLFPNYHRYSLLSDDARALVREAQRLDLAVLVQMRVEDERAQYPLMEVPGVAWTDVVKLAGRFPRARFVVLCAYYGEAKEMTRRRRNLWVDTAFLETGQVMEQVAREFPVRQVLFGSHAPFLYAGAGARKLMLARLSRRVLRQVAHANAIEALG